MVKNLFEDLPATSAREEFQALLETGNLRIERIISNGRASPADFWYDQEQNEWVLLLKGAASLQFEDGRFVDLKTGDYLPIKPHEKHRVEKTSADAIWLAVHYY